jgi:Protein of unknown function (DUF2845)
MRTILVIVGSSLLLVATVLAQPMRCGTGIINPGDSEARVLELCGPPAAAKRWTQDIPAGDDAEGMMTGTQIKWAELAYQSGPDQFVNKVVIRDGRVYEIKSQ